MREYKEPKESFENPIKKDAKNGKKELAKADKAKLNQSIDEMREEFREALRNEKYKLINGAPSLEQLDRQAEELAQEIPKFFTNR